MERSRRSLRVDLVPGLHLMPFTKLSWRIPSKIKRSDFERLTREIYFSELLTVANKQRKCSTFHIRSDQLEMDLELLEDLKLIFVPINKVKRVSGFAHRFYEPSPGEPYDIYGAVSYKREYAKEFKKASLEGNDAKLGSLLGYPKCCINHFLRVWPQEYDPIWSAGLNTPHEKISEHEIELTSVLPESNILMRYFGIRAVPHLVCSFNCRESQKFSKIFLEYIQDQDFLFELLRSPVTWDCWRGLAIVKTPFFVGVTNSMTFKERHIIRWEGL